MNRARGQRPKQVSLRGGRRATKVLMPDTRNSFQSFCTFVFLMTFCISNAPALWAGCPSDIAPTCNNNGTHYTCSSVSNLNRIDSLPWEGISYDPTCSSASGRKTSIPFTFGTITKRKLPFSLNDLGYSCQPSVIPNIGCPSPEVCDISTGACCIPQSPFHCVSGSCSCANSSACTISNLCQDNCGQSIEELATAGVYEGCGGGASCPGCPASQGCYYSSDCNAFFCLPVVACSCTAAGNVYDNTTCDPTFNEQMPACCCPSGQVWDPNIPGCTTASCGSYGPCTGCSSCNSSCSGTQTDSCGNSQSCTVPQTSCSSGQTCLANGSCCSPNTCAASICSTSTCNDGCETVPGTCTNCDLCGTCNGLCTGASGACGCSFPQNCQYLDDCGVCGGPGGCNGATGNPS